MNKVIVILTSLLVVSLSTVCFASKTERSVELLRAEQSQITKSIEEAKQEDSKLSGGLIKALIAARLELLQINSALVQQRINAIESGEKIKIKLYEAKPDHERARNLQSEMDAIKSEIKTKEEIIEKYRGGLIKLRLISVVSTMNNTLAMLQTEYLKAKYGIYWVPNINTSRNTASLPSPKKSNKSNQEEEKITESENEKNKYMEKIKISSFKAKYMDSLIDGKVPGVTFKLKNEGKKTLSMVEVTVYFMDKKGSVIHEESFHPVNTAGVFSTKPLKPNYHWRIERGRFYSASSVPDEWKTGKAKAKITDIEFSNE